MIELKNVKKYFQVKNNQYVKSVDDISLTIRKGETLGLVGESGSGKSTLGKTIVGIHPPTSGQVLYGEKDVEDYKAKEKQKMNEELQIIFQDPESSLNPRMRVGDIIAEGLDAQGKRSKREKTEIVYSLLEKVGLRTEYINRYPHEFSGGQRQRIGIARALAVNPKFIVADEPISALDVSIQAQIINLMQDLKEEEDLTYLFISHDLSMVKYISDRIAVMYLGKIVELADTDSLFEKTLHPYTEALLSAIPKPEVVESKKERILLKGEPPSPIDPPSGCRFRTRCPLATELCAREEPSLKQLSDKHAVACHYANLGEEK